MLSISLRSRWLRSSVTLACLLAGLNGCGGGGGNSTPTPTPTPTPDNSAEQAAAANAKLLATAMSSGDASAVDQAVIEQAANKLLDTQIGAYAAIKQSLFQQVGAIDWNPTHDSVWLNVKDMSRNQVMLSSNWRYSDSKAGSGAALAVAGTTSTGARYAVFGGNPLGEPGNAAMDRFMLNTVGWLSARSSSGSFKVVTAHLPGAETHWFPYETKVRDWFYAKYPGATVNGKASGVTLADNLCDGSALSACLQGADLLVISRADSSSAFDAQAVVQTVRDAQARGIPVLYLHYYRDLNPLSSGLMDLFGLGITNNYWDQEGLKAFDPATLPATPANLASIKSLLGHLAAGDFSTTWSGCTTSGRISCADDAAYNSEFAAPAMQLRSTLRALDAAGVALFGQSDYQLEKLLVLQGDKIRAGVSYPVDKADKTRFLRAYYSDMTAYINRGSSAVAQNLGNFAPLIAASTPALSQTVTTPPPVSGNKQYLTGLYVMPGKTVTLTRTDNSSATVSFGLNMLRDTTWVFNTLDRPTQISSPHVSLVANKTITITSPYGGPLLLFIDAASGSDPSVSVNVTGVITHPVLRDSTNPTEVAAFQTAVNTSPTNWVGFATDALTLQSTLSNFKKTMAAYNDDMAALASDTWVYTVKGTYEMAGFNAASGQLQLAATVKAVCTAKGWDCSGTQHRRDVMQHVISDAHAYCGSGCSGNPYDQDWAFQPLGWGETHEIGHNLQVARLKIYGGQSTEVSNNIFPMHAQMRFNGTPAGIAKPIVARANTGVAVFNSIKAALGSADPEAAMYASTWSDTSYAANNSARVMFYRQLTEYARYYNNQYGDNWEIFTLLYLLDRNMGQHAADWSTVNASYGFGTYASYPSAMDGNDFMLIAASNLIGRDMRPMFKLWGVTVSDAAKAQVAAFGLTPAGMLYFPMNDLAATTAKVGPPVTMTASAVYPSGY